MTGILLIDKIESRLILLGLSYVKRTDYGDKDVLSSKDNFANISNKHKPDSQIFEYQLFSHLNHIIISGNVIRIKIKWDDLWVDFINQMLQPVEGMTFKLHLEFENSPWSKFIKAFKKVFSPLYKSKSRIWDLKFVKKDIQDRKCSEEIVSLTKALSHFEIGNILVENWTVNNEWFKSLLQIDWQNIMWFRHWVFYYKNYKKFSDFRWKYPKTLMFDYWKYYYDENKELGNQKCAIIPFNKIEQFITYYLHIKVSHTKIAWLCFKNSFGVSNKIYTEKDLKSLINNWDNDKEILKLFKWDKIESSNMSIGSWIEDNVIINEKLKYNMK